MVSSSALPSPSESSMPPKSATLSTRPIHAPQALCLLCSSSLPPNRPPPVETKCCRRSICGTCVGQKARATRWDPCLYCAPGLRSGPSGAQEGAFVLGDDDDDDQEADNKGDPIERDGTAGVEELVDLGQEESCADDPPAGSAVRHIVRKGDTLIGISLKYGLDPHHLCTLNKLPQSTIHTTPHLLQTRSFILLLPSPPPPLPSSVQTQIAHERAIARFGKVTKEEDPLVRRTYVSLAELERDQSPPIASHEKEKDLSAVESGGTVEDRAVGSYLEDREWESRNGSRPRIPSFPTAGPSCPSGRNAYPKASTEKRTSAFDWSFGWGAKPKVDAGGFVKLG